MTWRNPLRSLTLRLTLVYMALFCGSVGLMLAVSYVGGVWRPLREVEDVLTCGSHRAAREWSRHTHGGAAYEWAPHARATTHAVVRLPSGARVSAQC